MLATTTLPYFLYSAGILYREGLEALLVVIALAAGLRNMGESHKVRDVYGGAILAVLASLGLAWAVNHVLSDNAGDTLEGVFQMLAAATLFYVSSWLTAKVQAEQWTQFISSRLESAKRSAMPSLAMGLTAFLAVMREGAETIVFFQGLLAGATETVEHHAIAAGIAVAAAGLAMTFIAIRKAASRIPLGIFFGGTSVLLYALAIVFVGQGVASFQEAGVVGATFVGYVPTVKVLGIFPTVQSLVAQGLLLIFAAAATLRPRAGRRRAAGRPDTLPETGSPRRAARAS